MGASRDAAAKRMIGDWGTRALHAGAMLGLLWAAGLSAHAQGLEREPVLTTSLVDPITGGPMVLVYPVGQERIAGEYVAAVVCREPDGTFSLWAATGQKEQALLALENEWGADIRPVEVQDPPFGAAIDQWYSAHGYPPPGQTWRLIYNTTTLEELGEWMQSAANQGFDIKIKWYWILLCLLFGLCDHDGGYDDDDRDRDDDNVPDPNDNCPGVPNPDQKDTDGDGQGDVCDDDDDGDNVPDPNDNCPGEPNPDQKDTDGDRQGDACDDDDDGDNVPDPNDNCPGVPNPNQTDTDRDGKGNACDDDIDGDGIPNGLDPDVDGDGIPNGEDDDVDGDGNPNGSDPDIDGDGIPNGQDRDADGDGIENGSDNDIDGDGFTNNQDSDMDGDGTPNDQDSDRDGDGIRDDEDEDDDADDHPDDDSDDDGGGGDGGGGGGGGSEGCELTIELAAVKFDSGPIWSWRDRVKLSPTPPGGWHWTKAGARYPVVSSYRQRIGMKVKLRVQSANAKCDSKEIIVTAYLGPIAIASGTFEVERARCPYEVEVALANEQIVPNTDAVRTLSGPVVFRWSEDRGRVGAKFGTAFPSTWYVMPSAGGNGLEEEERYDLGLEKVVQYARGASSPGAIMKRLNWGIDADVYYDPADDERLDHVLRVYWRFPQKTLCWYHAKLLEYLGATAGIGSHVLDTWGGANERQADVYRPWVGTFRILRPAHDGAEANPYFTYHSLCVMDGVWYDPSYGIWTPNAPAFAEVCEPYSVNSDGTVTCSPPNPQFVPRQQFGTYIWTNRYRIPCGGTPPP